MPVYFDTGGWYNLGTFGSITTSNATTTGTYIWPSWTSSSSVYNYSTTWTMNDTRAGDHAYYGWEMGDWGQRANGDVVRGTPTRARLLTGEEVRANDQRRQADATSRTQAVSRAEELLLSLLTEEQKACYREHGHVDVIGSEGGRYRLEPKVSGGVLWIPDGTHVHAGRFCAHPTMRDGWLPTPDVQVAQMLALMTDEREFIATANLHNGRRPTHLELVA